MTVRAALGLAMRAVAATAITVLPAAAIAQVQTATLRGTVIDRATQQPVAGAIVAIHGDLLATDDNGVFELALPPGTYTLEISAPFLVTFKQRVVVKSDVDLRFEVDAATDAGGERIEIVDIAPTAPGETRVDARFARAVPGGGDAGKVVQSLPAVARPPAGSAEIVVWGAAPRDTRVFVDGVPVPALYHLGGYRAAVGNELVGDIRLTPAAFGPARGRAIGGVIDIGTADPADAPAIRGQLDPLDASLAGKVALGPITIAAAARYSVLDRAIDAVSDPRELAPNAPLPRWSDAQIVARGKLSERTTLSGWILGSLDSLERTLASDDPATEVTEDLTQRWIRGQATVHRSTPRGADSATLWFGRDIARDAFAFGMTPASHDARAWVGGARAQQDRTLVDRPATPDRIPLAVMLALGADVDAELATLTRSGSLAIPAREGDPQIFGQPPGDDVSADRWTSSTLDVAGHSSLDLRVWRITATVGARVDAWMLDASRVTPRVGTTPGIGTQHIITSTDPRGAVQLQLTDAALVRVDGGRYHQARAASDASAVFGTPGLGLEQAWHLTAGGQYRASPIAIEAAAYARWLDDLVARDLAVTPPLAATLTQAGTGRVLGVQVTARLVGWRGLSGWLSYALSKSTRRDSPDVAERLFDHDQTHGLIAVGGWEHGAWTVGGRVRLSSGEPRTGVTGAFFDTRSGRFQPIRGPHNGERLPLFFAADLRGERRFTLAGATRGAIYLEVQNLTGRANPEEIIYNADFTEKSYLTSLPLLALAGLRIER